MRFRLLIVALILAVQLPGSSLSAAGGFCANGHLHVAGRRETLSGITTIQWNVVDSDSSSFASDLLFSPNGSTWLPVAASVTSPTVNVDVSRLPQTTQGRFRLITTDGFNTTQVDSNLFSVIGSRPTVSIRSPETMSGIPNDSPLMFQGGATDTEFRAIPDGQMAWSYMRAGTSTSTMFGMGRLAELTLPVGTYYVTLTAADSSGTINESTITVTVTETSYRVYLPMASRE